MTYVLGFIGGYAFCMFSKVLYQSILSGITRKDGSDV